MNYRRNPFVSGTLTHESMGSLEGYGYIGKDIYGKFHKSPILYKTEREAKEALMKRKFKRNPAEKSPKNRFKIGDHVIDMQDESKRFGRVTFIGAYDDYVGAWRIKVEDPQGHQLWWNAMPYIKKVSKAKGLAMHKAAFQTRYGKSYDSRYKKNPGATHEKKWGDYQKIIRIHDKADAAFTAALKKQFPRMKHLGDVRYDTKRHNAETKKAGDYFRKISLARHKALVRARTGNV